MQPIPVPRTLDARSRLLFWESDYVLAAMGGLVAGLLVSGLTAGIIGAFLFTWGWKKARRVDSINGKEVGEGFRLGRLFF